MKWHRESPPRWGERLLKRFVPPGIKGRSILGDAREEYEDNLRSGSPTRARLLYCKTVVSVVRHFAWRPRRDDAKRPVAAYGRRLHAEHLLSDLKIATRLVTQRPGLTMAAVITLGLGIGANTTLFSIVNTVLLRPLPYRDSDRLVGVFRIDPDVTGLKPTTAQLASLYAVPYQVYQDWEDLSPVFESSGAYEPTSITLSGGDRAEGIMGARVSSGVLETLGVRPVLGRPFLTEDDRLGAPPTVILSHGLWQRRFGSDSEIPGSDVVLDGVLYTIIGVMPPGFGFPGGDVELWINFDDSRKSSPVRKGGYLQVIARLRPGIASEQAQREMDEVARRIGEARPEEREHGIGLFPLKELVVSNTRTGLLFLLGAVGLVLLIACANMASLLLVRASERRKELGIRQALGAGRGRLLLQQLSEGVVLSLLGGVAGWLVAVASLRPLAASFPGGLPRGEEISADYRLLVFAAGLSLLTGLVTGVLPGLRAVRAPVAEVLRDGVRGLAGGRSRNRTQTVLVVSQIAIAFVLLASAFLFIRSLSLLTAVRPGFAAEDLLTIRVILPVDYRESEESFSAFFQELDERLGALPGVRSVARAEQMPFMGGLSFPPTSVETGEGVIEDIVHSSAVTPSYWETLEIPLVAGRSFTPSDRKGTQPVAVVNEAMVRKYWPDEDPIGRRVRIDVGADAPWITVVGVMADVKYRLNWDPFPEFFLPDAQSANWYQIVVVETGMEPSSITPGVREIFRTMNPDVPVEMESLHDRIVRSNAVTENRFRIFILGCLSGLAALLAVVGVYGVLAYTVAQRSHEIGIRMALGARKGTVVLSVLKRGLAMAGFGLGIGLIVSLAAARVIESLLFAVSPTDPTTLGGVALLVVLAAAASSAIPAYRATQVDPVTALKQE